MIGALDALLAFSVRMIYMGWIGGESKDVSRAGTVGWK